MRNKQHFSYGELIFLESQLITRHIVSNKDCRHTIEFNRGYHGLTIGNYNASNLMGFIFQSEYFPFTISHCQWCSQIRTDESLLLSRNKALGYLHRLVSFVQLKQRPLAFLFLLYVLIPLITLERAPNSFHFSMAVMVWGEQTWKIWMLVLQTQRLGGSPDIWPPASSTDLVIASCIYLSIVYYLSGSVIYLGHSGANKHPGRWPHRAHRKTDLPSPSTK